MILLKRVSFWLAILGAGAAFYLVRVQGQRAPNPGPVSEPARSPYAGTVAATGLIEAARENVKIASPKAALVTKVFVKAGDSVKAGDPLFQLDDREIAARIKVLQAQHESTLAQIGVEEAQIADWTDQYQRFIRLGKDQVAAEDEVKRREFSLGTAKARATSIRAAAEAAASQINQARTDLSVLTVTAPRDGRLLQVNVRAGEFAPAASLNEPLMLLGDVDTLQVRAEVDEQNAVMVSADKPAVASLKGHADLKMELRFVRIEPYVVPKRSLTGDSLERVDTRVLQIIYEFNRPEFPVYVGQQVDVFIERPLNSVAAK